MLAALVAAALPGCYSTIAPPAAAPDVPDAAPPDAPPRCPVSPTGAIEIARVRDEASLRDPAPVRSRWGSSYPLGDRVLWLYATTLLAQPAADGATWRGSTAAFAPRANPLALTERLDAAGAPREFFPLDAAERQENAGAPVSHSLQLWPLGVFDDGARGAWIYYGRWRVRPGFLNFTPLGVGVAHLAAGAADPVRVEDNLFPSAERGYGHGVRAGDHLYLYSCNVVGTLDAECRLARVPVAAAARRSAYTFWDGVGYRASAGAAQVVARGMHGFSMAWNAHLGRYLAVYMDVLGDRIWLRTATRPEGPWGPPVLALTGQAPVTRNNYGATLHEALSDPDGCELVLTYARPLDELRSETRLVRITLR